MGARQLRLRKAKLASNIQKLQTMPRLQSSDAKERRLQPHEVHAMPRGVVLDMRQVRKRTGLQFCFIPDIVPHRQIEGGSSFPDHYKWWNVFGCSGQQFSDPGTCDTFVRVRVILHLVPVVLPPPPPSPPP
jgi:hypothetical protein